MVKLVLYRKNLSYYTYAGYGLSIPTIFGIDKFGLGDYRVMGLFILTISFFSSDDIFQQKRI